MRRATIALLLLASPAAAQRATEQETGSHIPIPQRAHIPEGGNANDAVRGRLVMAQFARCVVDREYNRLQRTLALPAAGFAKAAQGLSTSECLDGGQIRFKPQALRGPLFKELYMRRMAAAGKGATFGPAIGKIELAVVPTDTEDQKLYVGLMDFAQCVVERSPEEARQVVLLATASAAQDQAIRTISPKLGSCISQGATLHLGKQVIEGSLAEVLYRGVKLPPDEPVKEAGSK